MFKTNIQFTVVADTIQSPFLQPKKPAIKNLVAFTSANNNIIWLSTDGFLYKTLLSDLSSEAIKFSTTPIKMNKKGVYKIIAGSQNIFLNNNGSLLLFNQKILDFENFATQVAGAIISPDDKNIVFWSNDKIYLYSFTDKKTTALFSGSQITDVQWMDNDYIIFTSVDKIIISEIDYRGNINSVTLPQSATQIFFNRRDNRLYVLTDDILISSEKLIP